MHIALSGIFSYVEPHTPTVQHKRHPNFYAYQVLNEIEVKLGKRAKHDFILTAVIQLLILFFCGILQRAVNITLKHRMCENEQTVEK